MHIDNRIHSMKITPRNTKAEILAAHGEATSQLQEVQQKLNITLALLATSIAIQLLF